MYKRFFFDVDNTLTRSRSEVSSEMVKAMDKLTEQADLIAVSGAEEVQIWKQLTDAFKSKLYILAQNGNYARLPGAKDTIWAEDLTDSMRRDIDKHILAIRERFSILFDNVNEDDLVQDRGCQVGFSLYGHNAPVEEKERFDPDRSLRKRILKEVPFESSEVEIKIGGTTTFDYFKSGSNKGVNVDRLIKYMDWKHDDCIYIGDGLSEGGNDESVIGVCDTLPVSDYKETLNVVNGFLQKKV